MRILSALFLFCLLPFWVRGQSPDSLNSFKGLRITQDPRIYQILDYRREEGKKLYTFNQGYRILLYSGTKRQEALVNQVSFKELYPKLETYLTYSFPNFRLQVGDFRSREDAQKISELLKAQLPVNPIVMPQKIDPTKVYTPN